MACSRLSYAFIDHGELLALHHMCVIENGHDSLYHVMYANVMHNNIHTRANSTGPLFWRTANIIIQKLMPKSCVGACMRVRPNYHTNNSTPTPTVRDTHNCLKHSDPANVAYLR